MSLLLDLSPTLDIMIAVGLFTTFTSLILRLIARYKQRLLFGTDDYLAVLAWFVFLGVNGASIYALEQQNLEDATINETSFSTDSSAMYLVDSLEIDLQRAYFSGMLCNIVALGCGRLSAVFFYRRIFYTIKQDIFDIVTKIVIGMLLLWTISFFLATLLACGTDIEGAATSQQSILVDHLVPNCAIQSTQNGLAISSFILDFIVLILPLPKIWTLHTPRARKIAISSVFLIALVSLTASGLRAAVVFQTEQLYTVATFDLNSDLINADSYFYQLLETAACLTAINMPSIWYLFRRSRIEKPRQTVSAASSSPFAKLRESAERSNAELSKNESMESSDSEAIPTRRAHLELETSHTFSQNEDVEK